MNSDFKISMDYLENPSFSYKGNRNVIQCDNEMLVMVEYKGTEISFAEIMVELSLDEAQKIVKKWNLFTEIDFDATPKDMTVIQLQLHVKDMIHKVLLKDMIQFPETDLSVLFLKILRNPANIHFLDLEQYDLNKWTYRGDIITEIIYEVEEDNGDPYNDWW